MWAWFFGGYAALVAILVAYSGHVAISCPDKQRRADAFRVLRLIWGTTGAGGVFAVAIRLHEVGALP